MREIILTDLFDKKQKEEIRRFLLRNKNKNPYELTKDLKILFGKWKNELEEKGIYSDYLAYAFSQKIAEIGYDNMIDAFSKKNIKKVL